MPSRSYEAQNVTALSHNNRPWREPLLTVWSFSGKTPTKSNVSLLTAGPFRPPPRPRHGPRSTPGSRPKRSGSGSAQPQSRPGGGRPPHSPSAPAWLPASPGRKRRALARGTALLPLPAACGWARAAGMALYNFKKITVVPSAKVQAPLALPRPSASLSAGRALPPRGGSGLA